MCECIVYTWPPKPYGSCYYYCQSKWFVSESRRNKLIVTHVGTNHPVDAICTQPIRAYINFPMKAKVSLVSYNIYP